MYTLLYLQWITSKGLPHSTGSSAQCHVAAGWEGSLGENQSQSVSRSVMSDSLERLPGFSVHGISPTGGEWIQAYVYLRPFAVRLKLSQHR